MQRIPRIAPPGFIGTLPWLCCLGIVIAGVAASGQEPRQDVSGAETAQQAVDEEGDEDAVEEKLHSVELADGRLVLQAPARWESQEPSVRIIEVELTVPAKDEKGDPGRLTIMRAGGTVEANIDRWLGQFTQPDVKDSRDAAKVEEKEIDGLAVHLVDISGTYLDRRGPAAPAQERADYRMLAAIIETDAAGNYFLKLVGPRTTMAENEKSFARMVEELQWGE
jgi:hypothetical protein